GRAREAEIDSGARPVVGVNVYTDDSVVGGLLPVSLAHEKPNEEQLAWLEHYKASRDRRTLADGLTRLRDAARDPRRNTFEAMLQAIDQGATTGEVTGAVRVGYGEDFDPLGMVDSPVPL